MVEKASEDKSSESALLQAHRGPMISMLLSDPTNWVILMSSLQGSHEKILWHIDFPKLDKKIKITKWGNSSEIPILMQLSEPFI